MRFLPGTTRILLIIGISAMISACGSSTSGGGDDDTIAAPIVSFELIDPTPGVGDKFGQLVEILANGNIVVSDPNDSSVAANNGAVHLYNPLTQSLIASIYGDNANDQLGFGSITALANGNFVIASPLDTVSGIAAAGSVRLIDGSSGAQIGATIAGDDAADGFGVGGVTALANSNYVISTPTDDVGAVMDAGSVRLVNGSSGVEIPGSLVSGDNASDNIGSGGAIELTNGNYVITSPFDNVGMADNGSVRLVNGMTGVEVSLVAGDDPADSLGFGGVIALANGNYVIGSPSDDEGATDNGSVRLVSGITGIEIPGGLIVADGGNDNLGFVTALPNSNYVISAPPDDVGAVINAGSVRLASGTFGTEIPGSLFTGDTTNDQLGFGDTIALANNNFVVASVVDNVGLNDNGSVRLINGATGIEIGLISGDDASDRLGFSVTGITALANNNFVIASDLDDTGLTDNGSVRLVNGVTGIPIGGGTITGGTTNDQLGSGGVTALANDDYVVVSPLDDDAGVDFGSVRLVDGTNGIQIGTTITGSVADDMELATVTGSPAGDYYILGLSLADNNAMMDSGLVRLIAL